MRFGAWGSNADGGTLEQGIAGTRVPYAAAHFNSIAGTFSGQPDQSTAATGIGPVHVLGRGLVGVGRPGASPP